MECLKNNFVKGQLLDGRFRTQAPLNHGSFGMVFLATDSKTGQEVAIKCLLKGSSDSEDGFEELECHRRFGFHPNLVNLIHTFDTEHHTYLVLEYCANGDLYEAIRHNRGPLETEHVRESMLQLISAVDFMHANGLYHRDIKPENIFLTQDGSMKLGDFGLATQDSWCHEACVGSDRYMAPEQYDPTTTGYSPAKADIWSVGVCLLNILFARNPFTTPTESDKIFADYVRDRQSLFDIFPNMSQDTYEILTHALAIDPSKRSLLKVRDCILRTISFTTDDESLDDFCCTEDREVVAASANREPLRTPSLQSPHVNQGDSFPWAKALQSSPPQAIRQLSAIPDNESYTEDLFPPSEAAGTSWFSGHMDTPSMASVMDSHLGESFLSLNLRKRGVSSLPRSDPVAITGSLPSHATKPLPSLSTVFGNNKGADKISKSWCDMWDEEESENEDLAMAQRREQNSRSWSHESQGAVLPGLREPDSASLKQRSQEPDVSLNTDHFEIHHMSLDDDSDSSGTPRPLRNSPPESSSADKWSLLGDVRRKYKPEDESRKYKPRKSREVFSPKTVVANTRRHDWGRGTSGYHQTKSKPASPLDARRRQLLEQQDWRSHVPKRFTPTYDGSVDDDLDLVGGWHETHF